LLKTSDNFYIYKNDIKKLLRAIVEDETRLQILEQKLAAEGKDKDEVEKEFLEIIYEMERGILNMEKRIAHIDTEHSKYVRATVSRLEYLLSSDDSVQGNVIALLNIIAREENKDEILSKTSNAIELNDHTVISPDSLYKRRGKRRVFEETVEVEESVEEELSKEDILRINRNKNRYSQVQIEQFIMDQMDKGFFYTKDHPIASEEEFELLILAYDYSTRVNSPFKVEATTDEKITRGKYSYPDMVFKRKG
jgi:hypothetical protein